MPRSVVWRTRVKRISRSMRLSMKARVPRRAGIDPVAHRLAAGRAHPGQQVGMTVSRREMQYHGVSQARPRSPAAEFFNVAAVGGELIIGQQETFRRRAARGSSRIFADHPRHREGTERRCHRADSEQYTQRCGQPRPTSRMAMARGRGAGLTIDGQRRGQGVVGKRQEVSGRRAVSPVGVDNDLSAAPRQVTPATPSGSVPSCQAATNSGKVASPSPRTTASNAAKRVSVGRSRKLALCPPDRDFQRRAL